MTISGYSNCKYPILLFIMGLLFFINGCDGRDGSIGSGNSGNSVTPPLEPSELKVINTSPSGGSTAVARDALIEIYFSEDLDKGTVNSQTINVKDDRDALIEPESIIVSNNHLTFRPKEKLYPFSTYTVTIAAGVIGKGGSFVPRDISYQFVTKTASWGTPSAFSEKGDAVVALDDRGNNIIAWSRYNSSNRSYEIMMSQLLDGSWTNPTVISGGSRNAFSPSIATDNCGNAIIIWQLWQQPSGIVIKEFRDGQWKNNVTVDMEQNTSSAPSIAMNSEGKAVIVWEQGGTIYKLEKENGYWGAVEKISTTADCVSPAVKLSKTGNIIITWEYNPSSYNGGKIYSKEYINGTWNTPKIISFIGIDPFEYKIASDSNGNAIIVWHQLDGNIYRVCKNEFRNNQWSSPTVLSPVGEPAFRPSVAISTNGNAIVTWQQANNWLSLLYQVFAMEYKDGNWTTQQLISPSGKNAIIPNVTLDRKGNGFLLWNQANGSKWELYRMEYQNLTWSNKQLLAVSNNELNPVYFSTSVNGGGDAVIVWNQSDGVNWHLNRVQYQ